MVMKWGMVYGIAIPTLSVIFLPYPPLIGDVPLDYQRRGRHVGKARQSLAHPQFNPLRLQPISGTKTAQN